MAKKEKKPKEPKPPKAPKPPKPSGPRISYPNDIFTVLVGVALAISVGSVSFGIYRCNELFGTPFPGFAG
jgi:hypothetical protein